MTTSLPNVLAAGDAQTGPATVVQAIAAGKRAASNINYLLTGTKLLETPKDDQTVNYADLNVSYFKPEKSKILVTSSLRTPKKAVIAEAKRCFQCGNCNVCLTCWLLCPDVSVLEADGQIYIDYDYCKGCGICAQECPCGAITMMGEDKWL